MVKSRKSNNVKRLNNKIGGDYIKRPNEILNNKIVNTKKPKENNLPLPSRNNTRSNKRNNFLARRAKIVNYGKLGATKKAFIGPKKPWVNIAPLPSNNAPASASPNNFSAAALEGSAAVPVKTRKIKAFNLPQFGSHDGGRRKKTHHKRR